ncbi:MAG: hypothetical protein BGO12_09675 [Verrucomicrobia bacterium 61-8]|nr:MAG: hypothetical protein BGO12_09675 [Verrucomicrobia bacterium 61-8]
MTAVSAIAKLAIHKKREDFRAAIHASDNMMPQAIAQEPDIRTPAKFTPPIGGRQFQAALIQPFQSQPSVGRMPGLREDRGVLKRGAINLQFHGKACPLVGCSVGTFR